MDKEEKSWGHKRFRLLPANSVDREFYYTCNIKNYWSDLIETHFSTTLWPLNIEYRTTISNAAFRICGVEVKLGLLMDDKESETQTIHGAVKPSIVIDTVLSLYGIFEGLGTLLFLKQQLLKDPQINVKKISRKHKWKEAIAEHIKKDVSKEIKILVDLRDRCIHQDNADTKGNTDYEALFKSSTLSSPVDLLDELLRSLSSEGNAYPKTPISEYSRIMKRSEYF